jgi:tetratricopeptide (TPR) repeat protein
LENWADAEVACGDAIDLDPDDFEARSIRVNILARDRRFEAALTDLNVLIGRYPEVADLHHQRGIILMKLDRWEAAKAALTRSIDLDPNRSTSHLALALLERRAGDNESCRLHLELVLELDPSDAEAASARRLLQELSAGS